jgi:hypothetical protein
MRVSRGLCRCRALLTDSQQWLAARSVCGGPRTPHGTEMADEHWQ